MPDFCGWIFALLTLCRLTSCVPRQNLILILVDGLANYYLDEPNVNLDGFERIQLNGVKAKSVRPTFPTTSLVNHYTITTGKYAEGHGVVGNYMFAPVYDQNGTYRVFRKFQKPSDVDPFWWNRTTPIWVTAQEQGLAVISIYWRLSGIVYAGAHGKMKNNVPYSGATENLNQYFPDLLLQIKQETINFAILFFKMVDRHGHGSGPNSKERVQATEMISAQLVELQDEMSKANLWSNTNLVVVSDHGQTDKFKNTKINAIEDCVNNPDWIMKVVTQSSLLLIHVNEGYEIQITQSEVTSHITNPIATPLLIFNYFKAYNRLITCKREGIFQNVEVTWRNDFPERFHFKDAPHLPQIILRATNYVRLSCKRAVYCFPNYTDPKGLHGWDNEYEDMQAMFVARGPAFKTNYTANSLEMVDLYQLFCHVLGIKMGHTPDGKWERVTDLLKNDAIVFDTW